MNFLLKIAVAVSIGDLQIGQIGSSFEEIASLQARQKVVWPNGERQKLSFGFDMQIKQSSSLVLPRTKLKYVKLQVITISNLGKVCFLGNGMTTLYRHEKSF
jgi:hypothetical protein